MTVIGVGLIGGSLGLVARRKRLVKAVVGYGKRRGEMQRAIASGAIDRYFLSLDRAIEGADLIVLATPVGTFEKLCMAMVPHLKPGTLVTDVGSVKGALVNKIQDLLPEGVSFVGAHPIAGRERSGVESASMDLFAGHRCILTPTPKTSKRALGKVRAFWEAVGASTMAMDPVEHDRIMAAVSHLPHLVAYALMETLSDPSVAKSNPVQFSGGGLRDFTRIAASSPEMWRDIFLANRENIVQMVDLYIHALETIKKQIISGDGPGLIKVFDRARALREKSLAS